jgi:hypothetical protein
VAVLGRRLPCSERDGPIRKKTMKHDLSEQTIADFGAQWTTFVDNEGYYGSIAYFLDTVSPLLSLDDVKGSPLVIG